MGGLFASIGDRATLALAAWRAAVGKRSRPEVREFFADYDRNLRVMSHELQSGTYSFAQYRSFAVRDTKSRTIHAPSFRDRVAHHAIMATVGSVLERGAIERSYACRTGRGQHAALRQAAAWTRRGDGYGKVDVEKYYDSIDHGLLRDRLGRRFRERRLLQLFERLLASYQAAPGRGIPIGALTSQYLGNFFLDELDHRLAATGLASRYVRYMDDIVCWGTTSALGEVRSHAHGVLRELGLRMKHGGEWSRCEQGVPFLGYVVYPDRVRLGSQGRRRLRRKLGALERAHAAGAVGERELQERGTSLFAHARFGDDVAWRRAVLAVRANRDLSVESVESLAGEAQEPESRDPGRLLEQRAQEVPLGLSQQVEARQPERQPGLPRLFGSRHGGGAPPDDALSRAPLAEGGAEPSGKPPADADFCGSSDRSTSPAEKAAVGAPTRGGDERERRSGDRWECEFPTRGVTIAFRWIEPGSFRMGARGYYPDEEPVHSVRITRGLWLGETPVTQEQFAVWVKATNTKHGNEFEGRPQNPAESLDYSMAVAFCGWLGRDPELSTQGLRATLPTEAQWEYACRAGTETEYWSGDGQAALEEVGWFSGNLPQRGTQPVASKPSNPWGLYDMHGNVWEWCRDAWDSNAYKNRVDGVADPEVTAEDVGESKPGRVVRGGSWLYEPGRCRSAYRRYWVRPVHRFHILGFRVCLVPGPAEPVER